MTRAVCSVRLGLAGAVALLGTLPALADASPRQSLEVWSAVEGVAPSELVEDIRAMPLSAMAVNDQPYCASDTEISTTLSQDFGERPIETAGSQEAELWGSDIMGTWTLVAPRSDETSCIIASGVGYSEDLAVGDYFRIAGL